MMLLRSKLLISIVMVAIVTLLFAVLTVGLRTNGEVRDLVSTSVTNRLVALREVQKERVENYFTNTFKVVTYTAENPATATAMEGFAGSFSLTPEVNDSFKQDLSKFYSGAFYQFYQKKDAAFSAAQATDIASKLDPGALFYQTRYIARNTNPIGQKSELVQAPKEGKFTARYEVYHAEFHPIFKQVRDKFEFVDLYLIDEQGRIVYSVEKNIEYATSLVDGPFASSDLGAIWQKAKTLTLGETLLSDYAAFTPAFSHSVAFVATPIFTAEKHLGTLIVQLDNNRLTQVMTGGNSWQTLGLGNTGEAYLVGADRFLRTQSRGLLQDSNQLLESLLALGNQPRLQAMTDRVDNVGLLQVTSPLLDKALAGTAGEAVSENYLGRSVLSAAVPVKVKDNSWALVVEMAESEVFQEVDYILHQALIYAGIVLVISIVLSYGLGVLVSRMIISPIKTLVASFHNIAEGDGDLSVHLDSATRKDEIGELSVSFNTFVKNIHDVVQKVVATAFALKQVSDKLADFSTENNESVNRQRDITQSIVQTISDFTLSNADIVENSANAQQAMTQASQAAENGHKTSQRCEQEMLSLGEQSRMTVESIQLLSNEIESISQILLTINGIAEQTSLLALNAAIEAARAGEQGRGFAVVADEVRSLSSRTQQATIDIQKKIEGLGKAADSAVQQVKRSNSNATLSIDLVKETAGELEKVHQIVDDIKRLSDAIDSLAGQQKSAVDGIETSVNTIQDMSTTALNKTQEVTDTTDELLDTSNKLAALVSRFKTRD